MVKSLKLIWFVLWAVVLINIVSHVSIDAMEWGKCVNAVSLVEHQIDVAGNPSSSSEAELVNILPIYQSVVSRIQRVQTDEYFSVLKRVLQQIAYWESSLSLHSERIYPSTVSCYYCHPVSEYYVFALRHIIV